MAETDFCGVFGDQSQPTRRKIIMAMKKYGGLTAAQLAEMLGITSMGVRRHLTSLERDKYVEYGLVQRGRGRPSYVYQLSQQAESLFPKNYAQLAIELLGYLTAQMGEEAVNGLFWQRAQRRLRLVQPHLVGKTLRDQVAGLTRNLSGDGYLAEWRLEDDGTFWIVAHNCAVRDVAVKFSAACLTELALFRAALPGAEVNRVRHLLAGELACAYHVRPRPPVPTDDQPPAIAGLNGEGLTTE